MGSTRADLKRDPDYEQHPDELAELRALLLGEQMVELQELRKRLDDPGVRTEEVSQVLASAVAISLKRNRDLQRAFAPVVENALQVSVQKNPAFLATALAPIIGEAVRKSVANAFRAMAESINLMVERSVSLESLKWRIEGWRTGKSFGEMVVLRSLRYKVQQVFLIHGETGLILQEVSAPGEGISEAELASSMLSALQDFVRDAFNTKRSQDLETVQTEDFTLWVHHGAKALLAAAILGAPPQELKTVFARENELIHQEFAAALASFNGDASAFAAARPHLQNCLLGQTGRPEHKPPRWWVLVPALIVIAAVALGIFISRRNARWNAYVAQLENEPGIVLTQANKNWGRYSVAGLRDPLAADPVGLAAAAGIPTQKLQARFEPYQSLDEPFVRERQFDSRKQSLEEQMILFPVNSSALSPEQDFRLEAIEEQLGQLERTAQSMEREVKVVLYGRADPTGAESKNDALSKERVQRVLNALEERGVAPQMISTVALGDSQPIRHGMAAHQLEVNRSVSLKVKWQQQGERP
jgi:outer membrane protein OmpA-like peptidoglycan-associated protein